MNTTIYYSKFNLDSSFAAMIISKSLQLTNGGRTQLIHYDRVNNFQPATNIDIFYLIGADISPLHLGLLIEENPKAQIHIANYSTSSQYNDHLQSKITHNLNKDFMNTHDGHECNSVSDMIFESLMTTPFNFFNKVFPSIEITKFKVLVDAITKYSNFLLMTKEEVLLVFKNLENITESLENNDVFILDSYSDKDDRAYTKQVKDLRTIIERNFSLRYYTLGNTWLNAPTLAISNENALAIMRLISYGYDDVVTYEDTASFRLYRIYSKTNKDWFIKCIKPIDTWSEGNILFLKTPVPAVERQ